jgi:hypothetical protein
MRRVAVWGWSVVALGLMGGTLFADQFHYNNVVMGDRAMGMGGAYCAIADDASGVVYNPAGLGFALSNDISGSANAFYTKKVTYKKTIGDDSFVENSQGNLAPFFGGLQKLDKHVPGLAAAFGIYTRDTELKDQNDKILKPELGIARFHRTVNQRASTTYYGGAVAKRLTANTSIGFGLNYISVDELVQEYQDAVQAVKDATGATVTQRLAQNTRQHLTATGIEPVIGFQAAMFSKLSLGLTIKKGILIKQKFEYDLERTYSYVDAAGNVLASGDRGVLEEELDKPLGTWPAEIRGGIAWFATTRFVWTFDTTYHTAVTDAEKLSGYAFFERKAVTNFMTGGEFYATPAMPLRLGLFTNNDARPKLSEDKTNQQDNIDYLGGSFFVGWVQTNSQISLGTVLQKGKGKAQKLGRGTLQDVDALATTFAFSATHSF